MCNLRLGRNRLYGFLRCFGFAATPFAFGATAIDINHDPLDRHSGWADVDETSRADQRQLHPGFDDDLHARLEMDLTHRTCFLSDIPTDFAMAVTADGRRNVAVDLFAMFALDDQLAIAFDEF